MSNVMHHSEAALSDVLNSRARRAFLDKLGKAALAAPAATSLIVAAAGKPTKAEAAYGPASVGQGSGGGKPPKKVK